MAAPNRMIVEDSANRRCPSRSEVQSPSGGHRRVEKLEFRTAEDRLEIRPKSVAGHRKIGSVESDI
jgi:hypothetical protein